MADDVATVSSRPAFDARVDIGDVMSPSVYANRPRRLAERVGEMRRRLRPVFGVLQEQLSPFSRLAPPLEDATVDERPPVEIMIDIAREDETVHERRMEKQLLKPLQRPE